MAQKVTKASLVDGIYQSTNLPKKEIQIVVESLFEEIKNSLCSGASIELRNFGVFELKKRKERTNCRNPKTGEQVELESHYVASFKSGKELKEKLWKIKI